MYFMQLDTNWNLNVLQGRYGQKRINAKQCTQDDFGQTEQDKKFYKDWTGFDLLCPDEKEDEPLVLKGEPANMRYKNIEFRVDRCDDSKRTKDQQACASEQEINDFIYDLEIDSWIIYEMVDYSIFNKKPVYKVMEVFARTLLNKDVSQEVQMYLRQHEIET